MPKQKTYRISDEVSVNIKGTVLYVDNTLGDKREILDTVIRHIFPKDIASKFVMRYISNACDVEAVWEHPASSYLNMTIRPHIIDFKTGALAGLYIVCRTNQDTYGRGRGTKNYMKATILLSNTKGLSISVVTTKCNGMFDEMNQLGSKILRKREINNRVVDTQESLDEECPDRVTASYYSHSINEQLFNYEVRNVTKQEVSLISNLIRNTLGVGKSDR